MSDPISETLELHGGPRDGERVPMPYVPDAYRIPIPVMDTAQWLREGPELTDGPSLTVGTYEPSRDEDFLIHRNDDGCLIYTWQGVRRVWTPAP